MSHDALLFIGGTVFGLVTATLILSIPIHEMMEKIYELIQERNAYRDRFGVLMTEDDD